MAESDVSLTVRLRDELTAPLRQLSGSVEGFANQIRSKLFPQMSMGQKEMVRFQKSVEDLNRSMGGAAGPRSLSGGFQNMTASIIKGGLALLAVQFSVNALRSSFSNAIQNAQDLENSMIGLAVASTAYGQNADAAREAAMRLSQDGLITPMTAAKGLTNLMSTGLGLDKAIELMTTYKDLAAFGRANTLSFDTAVSNLSESFLTESSIIGNLSGMQENYNLVLKIGADALGKSVAELNGAERAQAKYLGTLTIGQRALGNAERASMTLGGALASLKNQSRLTSALFGQTFAPVVVSLTRFFGVLLSNTATLIPVFRMLATIAEVVAAAIKGAVLQVVNMVNAVAALGKAIATLSFKPLVEEGKAQMERMRGFVKTEADTFGRIWGQSNEDILGQMAKANMDWLDMVSESTRKAAEQIAEAIAKENRDFAQGLEKQAKDFADNLKDLVLAHRDKAKELEKQLSEENADFDERMEDRKLSFDKAMADIERRHQEKVDTIEKQLTKESLKVDEITDGVERKYAEQIGAVTRLGQDRLGSLQRQLDTEKAKGESANKARLAAIEEIMDRERRAIVDQLDYKEEQKQIEVEKETRENRDRIAELEDDLEKEKTDVAAARAEKETDYERETAKIKSEHQKRAQSLQEQLNLEKEIQKRHADDFIKFQDAVAEDDIARLKRKFAEERQIMEREHQDRLNDIARRAQEERATRDAAQVQTSSQVSQTNQQVQQAASQVAKTAQNVQNQLQRTVVANLAPAQVSQPSAQLKSGGGGGIIQSITNFAGQIFGGIKSFFGFQKGGIITRPTAAIMGERGPEAVIPLTNPRRTDEVLDQAGVRRGNVNISAPITVVSSEVDVDLLVERLAFQMRKL